MKKIVFLSFLMIFIHNQMHAADNSNSIAVHKNEFYNQALRAIDEGDAARFNGIVISHYLHNSMSGVGIFHDLRNSMPNLLGAADLKEMQLREEITQQNKPSWRSSSFFIYLVGTSAFSLFDIYHYMNNTPTSPSEYAKMAMDFGNHMLFLPVAYTIITQLIPNNVMEKLKETQKMKSRIIARLSLEKKQK